MADLVAVAKWPALLAFFSVLAMAGLSPPARGVTIDWVTVGDPGNEADAPAPNSVRYGGVAHVYQIGKFEITIGQYTDFLNAVAANDLYGLYNDAMGTDLNVAGISRSGGPGTYTYSVISNSGSSVNRPITYVSWFDAARFANWLMNGQGAGDTETGAYTLNGATSGDAPAVNPGATFYIPTADEWYKAAYYKGGGTTSGYWTFATQSDVAPGNTVGPGANQANWYVGSYPNGNYATGPALYDVNQNYLTDGGAFSGSGSAYGTFDQTGNVWEWNDRDGVSNSRKQARGGYWDDEAVIMLEAANSYSFPDTDVERSDIGFRLARPVPEPPTMLIAIACGGALIRWRRTRAAPDDGYRRNQSTRD